MRQLHGPRPLHLLTWYLTNLDPLVMSMSGPVIPASTMALVGCVWGTNVFPGTSWYTSRCSPVAGSVLKYVATAATNAHDRLLCGNQARGGRRKRKATNVAKPKADDASGRPRTPHQHLVTARTQVRANCATAET